MNTANRSLFRLEVDPPATQSLVLRASVAITCSAWLIAVSISMPAKAADVAGLTGIGPAPTGLAASAFLDFQPARLPADSADREAKPASVRPSSGGTPVSWRPRSPSERLLSEPVDVDLFPHMRRAVPLLVPDVVEVTSQRPLPDRAMRGPSVGVPWRIPGYAP